MKPLKFYKNLTTIIAFVCMLTFFSSCEGELEQEVFTAISPEDFPSDAAEAVAFVNSSYGGLGRIYACTPSQAILPSSLMARHLLSRTPNTTRVRMQELDLSEDFGSLGLEYTALMKIVTMIAIKVDQISKVEMDEDLKNRYIGELYGLRAIYTHWLYDLYGPVPVRLDPVNAIDPNSAPIPRPSKQAMLDQIEDDYLKAAAALPERFSDTENYGRITSAAAYTGLMKLYLNEKNWEKVIEIGDVIQDMGYSLVDDYATNFELDAIGGNSEIILAIPTRIIDDPSTTRNPNTNSWQIVSLPPNYRGSTNPEVYYNPLVDRFGWFLMPWEMYDKFVPGDERTKYLFAEWIDENGDVYDGRAEGEVGAVALKYAIDPLTTGEANRINIICMRYSDVLLMKAEAINEESGPIQEAHDLINTVRNRAELGNLPSGLTQEEFRLAIMDERFFELWAEGSARTDMIRWGTFIQNQIDNGSTTAKPEFTLWPIPRTAINESNGVIEQNPGY